MVQHYFGSDPILNRLLQGDTNGKQPLAVVDTWIVSEISEKPRKKICKSSGSDRAWREGGAAQLESTNKEGFDSDDLIETGSGYDAKKIFSVTATQGKWANDEISPATSIPHYQIGILVMAVTGASHVCG